MTSAKPVLSHQQNGKGFYIAQFKTGCLSIFSYYVQSNKQVVLIDPTIDVQIFRQHAEKRGAKITQVILTHYHADFLAGHLEFDVPIIMGQLAERQTNHFKVIESKNGQKINLGSIFLKTLHTPGHTTESSCFRLFDENGKQFCIFTGDTIFLGQVGRPDLAVNSSLTKQELAKMLFHSLQKIMTECDPEARVYPAHGAGSSCGKKIGDGNYCDLKTQMEKNYALKIKDEKQFVQTIISGMPQPPAYYFHDATINQQGSKRYDQLLKACLVPLSPQLFEEHIKNGAIGIDVRNQSKVGYIKGIYIACQKGTVGGWVGSIWSPNQNFLVFADNQKTRNETIERLLRIGYFNIKGYNDFTMDDWKAKGYGTWDMKQLNAQEYSEIKDGVVLDVRKMGEWMETGVVEGAITIPLHEIDMKWEQLKGKQNIYVHCRSGLRAKLAASILKNHGIDSTIIFDQVTAFANNGIKMVPYK